MMRSFGKPASTRGVRLAAGDDDRIAVERFERVFFAQQRRQRWIADFVPGVAQHLQVRARSVSQDFGRDEDVCHRRFSGGERERNRRESEEWILGRAISRCSRTCLVS